MLRESELTAAAASCGSFRSRRAAHVGYDRERRDQERGRNREGRVADLVLVVLLIK